MKASRLEIFFLIIFFQSGIQNELRPNGENVCLETVNYEEPIIEKVKKTTKDFTRKKCWNILKKFSCKRNMIKWKTVDEPRVTQRSKVVPKCCSGYTEQTDGVTRCVPVCPAGCVHGRCTAPDKCTCTYGFQGRACDKRSIVTTVTPKTTAQMNSTTETSTQGISQATKKGERGSTTLMFEILKITNTDFVTQTTIGTADATVRMAGEVALETSTTEMTGTENEKEISTEISISTAGKDPLNLTTSAKTSTEETGMEIKYSTLMEKETSLGNFVSSSTEKLNSKGNELSTNAKTIFQLEDTTESTNIVQSTRVYHSTSLLYTLPATLGLVLAFAWWLIVIRRKKYRESKTKNQQMALYSQEQIEFCVENLFWSKPLHNRSRRPINTWDAEPKNPQSVLLDLQVCDRSPVILPSKNAHLLEKQL